MSFYHHTEIKYIINILVLAFLDRYILVLAFLDRHTLEYIKIDSLLLAPFVLFLYGNHFNFQILLMV